MRRCPSTYLSLVRAALTDAGAFEAFYVSWAVPLHCWLREQVFGAEVATT
jgi:hypothetical protein